jgi:hypothetical protein
MNIVTFNWDNKSCDIGKIPLEEASFYTVARSNTARDMLNEYITFDVNAA